MHSWIKLGAVATLAIVAGASSPAANGQTVGLPPGLLTGDPSGPGAIDPPDVHYQVTRTKSSADMVAFVDNVRLFLSADVGNGTGTLSQIHRHMRRSCTSLARGLEALRKLSPSEEQQLAAITTAMDHFRYVQAFSQNGYGDVLLSCIARLAEGRPKSVQEKVSPLALDFEILLYAQKTAEERTALADVLVQTIKQQTLSPAEADRLIRFCEAAETAGDLQLAMETIDKLRPTIDKYDGLGVDLKAVLLGLRRRLSLKGKPLEIEGTIRDMVDPGRVGPKVDLESYRNKVIVLYFFDEMAGGQATAFSAVQNKYGPRGVQVVGFFTGMDGRLPLPIFTQLAYTYPIVISQDGGGRDGLNQPTCLRYGLTRMPRILIVGRDGTVVSANSSLKSLEAELEMLLR
jgi:hypothetical protein